MNLSKNQISKIKQKIDISENKSIIRIDVSEDKNMSSEESSSNIYCVNDKYEIFWQVQDIKTKRPFEDDMFVYLGKNAKGEIIADRFSGFEYKIDPETGEADQMSFHK